jgi:protocatechuate 3,4-dioxygenase beta subunit
MVSLLGCSRKPSASAELSGTVAQTSTGAVGQSACIVRPQQTEGPYFVDEGLNRSDIRSDPATGSVKPGVPLTLQFQVSQVGANACVPLAGAIVDVWHCDAAGAYSDVADRNANTLGQKFLRGSQVTNADGTVEFTTIYPGWYPGRTVHIHFKIRGNTAANQGYEFYLAALF